MRRVLELNRSPSSAPSAAAPDHAQTHMSLDDTYDQPSPGRDARVERIARLAARALGAPAAALWVPRDGLRLAAGYGLDGVLVRVDELALEVDRPALIADVA